MSYETSYDIGLKPFNHDKNRGKWAHPTDFLFACIGHAFKADPVLVLPMVLFRELGFYALFPYLLILAICVIPIVFMQSFLGQFSGTGFISVFRIAPLFKGIGYVSLGLNLITLTYYSIFSAIQLFQLFYTLRPTIPWSCEGSKEWMVLGDNSSSVCSRSKMTDDHIYSIEIPSVDFFSTHIDPTSIHVEIQFSWMLMVCAFLVWIMVLLVSLRPVEMIGRVIRYSFIVIIGCLSLILVRCMFLPSALFGLAEFFVPLQLGSLDSWFMIPWMALGTLGPGWGTILTMASFNKFKTNIYSFSWITALAHLGVLLGMSFISMLMWGFLLQAQEMNDVTHAHLYHAPYSEYMAIPTALTLMELPHFWSVIFFVMMLLGSVNLLIVQLLSVLTSVFDEFEGLRARKRDITMGTVGCLAVFSIYFCSNHGVDFMQFLAKSSLMTQMLLNLLLILVVLWVYGRERFQRDVDFMISHLYSRFMTNVVRFVTPLFLLVGMLTGFLFGGEHIVGANYTVAKAIFAAAVIIMPWCLIPWYCIFKLMQTSGVMAQRFRRCARPTDWYPADPLQKQRYEETFSNPEASHQLTMATED